MSLPNNPGAYADCHKVFDRALADPDGVRVEVPSYNDGIQLRMRLQMARKLDRDENAKTYPKDHPLHNRSAWDMFICRIKTNGQGLYWVYVEPAGIDLGEIEALADVTDDDVMVVRQAQIMPPERVLQIEHIKRRV